MSRDRRPAGHESAATAAWASVDSPSGLPERELETIVRPLLWTGAAFAVLLVALILAARALRDARSGTWSDHMEAVSGLLLLWPCLFGLLRLAVREARSTPGARAIPGGGADPAATAILPGRWIARWFAFAAGHGLLTFALVALAGRNLIVADDGSGDSMMAANLFQIAVLYFALFSTVARFRLVRHAIHRRDRDRVELAVQLESARLALLRAQLDPHFVFNGLHSITSLLAGRPAEAQAMLGALRELLAQILATGGGETYRLAEEIELARAYTRLQAIRFESRLEVAFDLEPATLDAQVPTLILQPLLENSIKHGLRPGHSLRVSIRAAVDPASGRLVLEVRDNGRGAIPAPGPGDGTGAAVGIAEGLGLRNTRARLGALYGAEASFEFQAGPAGAVALLRLPLERERAVDPAGPAGPAGRAAGAEPAVPGPPDLTAALAAS